MQVETIPWSPYLLANSVAKTTLPYIIDINRLRVSADQGIGVRPHQFTLRVQILRRRLPTRWGVTQFIEVDFREKVVPRCHIDDTCLEVVRLARRGDKGRKQQFGEEEGTLIVICQ